MKENDPVEEGNTMAAFKRSVDRETLTKQQRMQNDIDAYNETQVKLNIVLRMNPEFPITRKAPKKRKKVEINLRAVRQSLNLGRELRNMSFSTT